MDDASQSPERPPSQQLVSPPPPPPMAPPTKPAAGGGSGGLPAVVIVLLACAGVAVLAIPLVLGLLLPALSRARGAARAQMSAVQARMLALDAAEFARVHGRAPATLDECASEPTMLFDRWGQPFELRVTKDESGAPVYEVWSKGPDNEWGTDDDRMASSDEPTADGR